MIDVKECWAIDRRSRVVVLVHIRPVKLKKTLYGGSACFVMLLATVENRGVLIPSGGGRITYYIASSSTSYTTSGYISPTVQY